MTNTRRANKGATGTKMGKEGKAVKADASASVKKSTVQEKKKWNTMSHLYLKRFADDDPTLTAGAKRDRVKHPHLAVAELDPSGRAQCKLCGEKITKSTLRFGLWLECHKGYRNLCTLHPNCFWKHPETNKLDDAKEIHLATDLNAEQRAKILESFDQLAMEKETKEKSEVDE